MLAYQSGKLQLHGLHLLLFGSTLLDSCCSFPCQGINALLLIRIELLEICDCRICLAGTLDDGVKLAAEFYRLLTCILQSLLCGAELLRSFAAVLL